MRILHTADWHLGQRFHDQRRAEDEAHALDQVVTLARQRRVDAVLVAGDIFDTANPGAEEQRRYYRCLKRLVSDAGVPTVVVTGGNHDSALRLDGPRELLDVLGIRVVGRLAREADAGRCVIPLDDRQGRRRALCLAVPYLRDGDLRRVDIGEKQAEIHERYARALEERYRSVHEAADAFEEDGTDDNGTSPLPRVVMGHCYVTGGVLGGGERPVQIGNLARADANALAGNAAYLALGHLHRPQVVGGRDHWRYCGSLLPTGFDEVEKRREVVIVELADADGPATVERIPLEPFRRYLRLEGKPEELEHAIDALERPTADQPAPWCEASVRLEGPRPGIARELGDRCRERGWTLISVRRERPTSTSEPTTVETRDLKELDPEEVFEEMHRQRFDGEPDDALRREFLSLLEEVSHGGDGTGLPESADAETHTGQAG